MSHERSTLRHMDRCLCKCKASRQKGVAFVLLYKQGVWCKRACGSDLSLPHYKIHSSIVCLPLFRGTGNWEIHWKRHLGSCLLLLTHSVNNTLMYCHEVLPVLCSSSTADVICLTLTIAKTQAPVHVDVLYMHVSCHTTNSTHSCFQDALSTSY